MADFQLAINGIFKEEQLKNELLKYNGKLDLTVNLKFNIGDFKKELDSAVSSVIDSKSKVLTGGVGGTSTPTISGSGTTIDTDADDISKKVYTDGELTRIERMTDLKNTAVEYYEISENGEAVLSRTIETSNTNLKDRLTLQKKLNEALEDMNYTLSTSSDISKEQKAGFEEKLSGYSDKLNTTDISELKTYGRELKTIKSEIRDTIILNRKNKSEYKRLTEALKSYENQGKLTSKETQEFNNRLTEVMASTDALEQQEGLSELNSEIVSAANSTGLLGQSLTKAIIKYTTWLGIATIIAKITRAIKSAIQEVEKLDTALMELSKVSDLTKSELSDFAEQAYKTAEEVHSTGLGILEATTEFARMGYTMEQSLEMGKYATMMTNIAEDINSASEASKILISVIKGLGSETLSALDILNKFNEVSNNNAVSFGALADMAQTATATMSTLGNTFDQTIAMLTGAYEVLQDERVAKGLSTIGLRIAGLNEDMESVYGLSNEISKSLSKYAGIDIFNASGDLKTTYQIFSELADKWDKLSISVRSMLLNVLASKGRADVASALLKNWEAVKDAIQDAENSTGSAIKENEKYADSIKGIKTQIENLWSEIKTNLVNSEDIKILLELFESILNLFTLIKTNLSTIMVLIGAVLSAIGALTGHFVIAGVGIATLFGAEYIELTKLLQKMGIIVSDTEDKIEETTNSIINGVQLTTDEYEKYDEVFIAFKRNLDNMITSEKENIELQKEKNRLLQKQKNLEEKVLSVEKARAELDKAKTQRTIEVYRVGVGYVYEADREEIETAQEKLDKAIDDLTSAQYDYELDRAEDYLTKLNELLKSDNALEGWQELFDSFDDIATSSYSYLLDETRKFVNSFNETLKSAGLQSDLAIDLSVGANASGTSNWHGGLSLVGENGAELVNLPKGSEVINHSRTTKLTKMLDTGSLGNSESGDITLNFNGDLSFPNVTNGDNAKDFISAIINIGNNRIPNMN